MGTWVTYACVCKQDQTAKAKMRWEFQKMFRDPKRATLSCEKSKEQAGNARAAFSNDAILMINTHFLLLSFLSRMIFELKESECVKRANPRRVRSLPGAE